MDLAACWLPTRNNHREINQGGVRPDASHQCTLICQCGPLTVTRSVDVPDIVGSCGVCDIGHVDADEVGGQCIFDGGGMLYQLRHIEITGGALALLPCRESGDLPDSENRPVLSSSEVIVCSELDDRCACIVRGRASVWVIISLCSPIPTLMCCLMRRVSTGVDPATLSCARPANRHWEEQRSGERAAVL